jgi:hypothetical protein
MHGDLTQSVWAGVSHAERGNEKARASGISGKIRKRFPVFCGFVEFRMKLLGKLDDIGQNHL